MEGICNNSILEMLPNELLEAIFMLISSTKDLKSLCLVDKQSNVIATKLLWEEPQLKLFTLEDFRWISGMPIQVLDISRLTPSSDWKNVADYVFNVDSFVSTRGVSVVMKRFMGKLFPLLRSNIGK